MANPEVLREEDRPGWLAEVGVRMRLAFEDARQNGPWAKIVWVIGLLRDTADVLCGVPDGEPKSRCALLVFHTVGLLLLDDEDELEQFLATGRLPNVEGGD